MDLLDSGLGNIPVAPPHKVVKGKDGLPGIHLDNGESIVMPNSGKGALKRVFLGVGWRQGKTGGQVDVDCSVNGFANGTRSDPDTVYYGNLHNPPSKRDMKDFVSIKHSGDILTGQNTSAALEDLERIYCDLENLGDHLDMLVFECNIYTGNMTFRDLDECYVRLVNADTNQEVMRFNVEQRTPLGKEVFSTRCMIMGTLTRGDDRWVLQADARARKGTLKSMDVHQPEFSPHFTDLPQAKAEIVNPTGGGGDKGAGTEKRRPGKVAMGKSVYMVPLLAIGTVASVAAATAMFAPEAFSHGQISGFPFPDLADMLTSLPDLGPLGSMDCCCIPLDVDSVFGPCAGVIGDTPGFCKSLVGGCPGGSELGSTCESMMDCGCIGEVCSTGDISALFSDCGDFFGMMPAMCAGVASGIGDIAGNCGDVVKCCSGLGGNCGDGAGQVFGACGDIGSVCNDLPFGDCAEGLGDCVKGILKNV